MSRKRNQYTPLTLPDWAIRPFPQPHIIAKVPNHECACSWVYAPDITGIPAFPFIIKFPSRQCREHAKEYYAAHAYSVP